MILLPLVVLLGQAVIPAEQFKAAGGFREPLIRSFVLAGIIAMVSVVLGIVPGKLLTHAGKWQDILLLVLLMPLVLPQYVLYYAWTLLATPTSGVGRYVSANPGLAKSIGEVTSSAVLILWYWPLASLLISQGWRNIDHQIWDNGRLDASKFQIFKSISLPLLLPSLCLAFGVCFVLSLSEFTTFQLAGIRTIGTEIAVLYEMTGSLSSISLVSRPLIIAAIVVAIMLSRKVKSWESGAAPSGSVQIETNCWQWSTLLILMGISLLTPIVLLVGNCRGDAAFKNFFALHMDELEWSVAIGAITAVFSYLVALGPLLLDRGSKAGRVLSIAVCVTIFLAMFLPASLMAASLLQVLAFCNVRGVPPLQSWYIVSIGQSARFAGLALIVLLLTRASNAKQLSEIAEMDGASRLQTWRHVHLPRTWRLFAGTFILILMFSITELPATMMLLPAGLPNFAQRLLNQMHYARDQQVIALCLILIGFFVLLAGSFVLLIRGLKIFRYASLPIVCFLVMFMTGCSDNKGDLDKRVNVVKVFGLTGWGHGEFVYPRAITIVPDGSIYVVDRTGRIQHFTSDGDFIGEFKMPLVEAGKPTGLTIAPDGNIYVADTHYHRVMIFTPDGKIVGEFGKFGEEAGCFIYPTGVAFSGDGRIFVSEYGGNDRISVFDEKGKFLYCFGKSGNDKGQLSRPSAVCVDKSRKRLYVADACNHRVAVYDFDGNLLQYIGSAGRKASELRYPYGLSLMADGSIAVCEYGNNRIQLFSAEGKSLGVYGKAGREAGQLAFPWSVAVDSKGRAFVVDAGNNRIQIWKF